ncbi:MAG: aldo/keto reductase [bacterium]
MKYSEIGNKVKVSKIALGTWAIGGNFWGESDDAKSIKTIEVAIDSGINLIDTAPAYGRGHSEKIVGKAIKGKRDKVVLSTKCGLTWENKDARTVKNLKPESIRKEIDDSLRRLGTDMIDIYFIHWPDKTTPLEDSLGELSRIKDTGKIRFIGVSNFDIELLSKAVEITNIDCVQPPYSMLDRDIEKDILPFCRENNIAILSYGSLGGGILTGKYTDRSQLKKGDKRGKFYPYFQEPQWSKVQELVDLLKRIAKEHNSPTSHVALNWVRQQPGITSALVGARTPEQARENADSANWDLSEKELKEIEKAYRNIF